MSSLKYFCEDSPEFHIICASSLLSVALYGGTSFPVGKVDFLKLYPLSYKEFLMAMGKERFVTVLEHGDYEMMGSLKQTYMDALRQYYLIGGMPEVVLQFSQKHDFHQAREVQRRILDAYEQDFSKHTPNEIVPKIRMVWNSIPSQLAKEKKKFIYGLLREGDGNDLFKEFKGALTEQYVMQQLATIPELHCYYYTNSRGSCEIDFVVDNGERVVPVEVKVEVNLKAKSLKTFCEKFHPEISIRTAMTDYKVEGTLINLPLYAIEMLGEIMDDFA